MNLSHPLLLITIALLFSSQVIAQSVNQTAIWTSGAWGECDNCDTDSPTQSRQVYCTLDSTSVATTQCTGSQPDNIQACECASTSSGGGLSLTAILIGIGVAVVIAVLLFIACCIFKNYAKRKFRESGYADDEADMTQEDHDVAEIENEVRAIRAKRAKKKARKPHLHSEDAAAIAKRAAKNEAIVIDVQPAGEDEEDVFNAPTEKRKKKHKKHDKQEKHAKHGIEMEKVISPQPRHQPQGSLGPRMDGDVIDPHQHLSAASSSSTAVLVSPKKLQLAPPQEIEFPEPADEVARAIYNGQLSLAPLASSLSPLDSVKKKKKSKRSADRNNPVAASSGSPQSPHSSTSLPSNSGGSGMIAEFNTNSPFDASPAPPRRAGKSNIVHTPNAGSFQ